MYYPVDTIFSFLSLEASLIIITFVNKIANLILHLLGTY